MKLDNDLHFLVKAKKILRTNEYLPILNHFYYQKTQAFMDNNFDMVSEYTYQILFCIPLMVWSRINIIFSRALNFEINLTKTIIFAAILSYFIYFITHAIGNNPAVFSIIISQVMIAALTTYSFRKSYD